MGDIERIGRELVYEGTLVKVYKDKMKISNGNIVEWDFIHHNGAAAVVPVCDNGNLLLVRQYRNALERMTLEIPAGKLDSEDEEMIVCATRELEEETGFKSKDIEFLISLKTTVAFCDEKIDVFVARNLIKSEQKLDEDEFVDVVECKIEDLLSKIYSGEIQDSKTVAAIMAYYGKYVKE